MAIKGHQEGSCGEGPVLYPACGDGHMNLCV